MTTENKQPPSFVEAVEQRLEKSLSKSGYLWPHIRQALTEVLAAAEPVLCEAVATFDNGEVDWLLEGGVSALDGGGVLYFIPISTEDGSLELFTAPPADERDARIAELREAFALMKKAKELAVESAIDFKTERDELRTQLAAAQLGTEASTAAIRFAMKTDCFESFLDCWLHGDFDVLRREWPEAPEAIYIGADPQYKPS